MARERHDVAFMVGALIGGLAGGLYGLATAPQAGARTRADLASRWAALTERGAEAVAAADTRVRAALHRDEGPPPTAWTPSATPLVSASGPFVEADGEAVLLLPDPLEPDPVALVGVEVEAEVDTAEIFVGSGTAPVVGSAAPVGGMTAADEPTPTVVDGRG